MVPHRNLGLLPVLEVLGIQDFGYLVLRSKFVELSLILPSDVLNSNKNKLIPQTFSWNKYYFNKNTILQ